MRDGRRGGLTRIIRAERRALALRCPRCGRAPLFRGWFRMNVVCAVCDLRFERAQGYWVGAIYVNYAATTVAIAVGGFFLLRTLDRAGDRRPAGAVGAVRDRVPAVVLPLQPQPLARPRVRTESGDRESGRRTTERRPGDGVLSVVATLGLLTVLAARRGGLRGRRRWPTAASLSRHRCGSPARRPALEPITVSQNRDVCGDTKDAEALVLGPDRGVRGSVILVGGVARGKQPVADVRARQQQVHVRAHVSAAMAGRAGPREELRRASCTTPTAFSASPPSSTWPCPTGPDDRHHPAAHPARGRARGVRRPPPHARRG